MKFQLPETLPATAAELDKLLDAARAEIQGITVRHAEDPASLTDEDAADLEKLLGDVDTITSERGKVSAAEAEATGKLNDLLTRASQVTEPPKAPEGGEPAPEGDGGTGGGEAAPEVQAEVPAEKELVAAGAGAPPAPKPSFAGAGAGQFPAGSESTKTPGWDLHHGAPGFKEGMGKIGFAEIAKRLESIRPGSRASIRPNRPNKRLDGTEFARQVVASLSREVSEIEDSHALVAAINAATRSSNLAEATFNKSGSLTAAGGWCAPSEQLYDFCDVPDATDLLSVPEITINRGGVRWPREPDLSSIFADFEWFFTETQLEAVDGGGDPTAVKTCVEIPCVDTFDEIRLNAVGWCVESGILQEQGWPELSEWFMRNLTQEHLRALSRRTILDIVSGSGSAIVIPPTSVLGSVASILNSLALMATNLRLKRGLSRSAIIEGIAPSWFFEVLRADLAMRQGLDVFAVTDAQIQGWLSARNIRLQFVGDWQTRSTGLPGALATTQWPGTVDVVLYPAGTWFRSMSNVIELGVMYPKEQLQVNRFTRMFTEDAIAVGKRCGESILVRIPLNTSGEVGARRQITIDPGNKVAALSFTGIPTGGTGTVLLGGRETGTIAFNASAANVKTALVALDDAFTAADFTTSGGPLPAAVTVTYPAELGSLVKGTNSLTGGTSPAISVV